MELLWIFVGIGYVVFRLFKDGEMHFSWKNLGGYILTIIPLVLGGIILSVSERNYSVAGMVVGAIIWIAWFIGLFVWAHSKPKKEPAPPKPKYTVQELRQEFQKYGYVGISQRVFENLLNNVTSPLNAAHTPTVTIKGCYNWMCEQETWEIDKLSRSRKKTRCSFGRNSIRSIVAHRKCIFETNNACKELSVEERRLEVSKVSTIP